MVLPRVFARGSRDGAGRNRTLERTHTGGVFPSVNSRTGCPPDGHAAELEAPKPVTAPAQTDLPLPKMTAEDVLRLLAARHSHDVFVPECKDGPTQSVRNHSRLDAWVMPRSWAHPACTGYEIKVSRADFLGDHKWTAYLDLCNYLYFVGPEGVIQKDEVPEGCGWLKVSKAGRTLRVAKKAPYREVEIPESLWRYVLMCRSKIVPPNMNGGECSKEDYWRDWLREKVEKRDLGRAVSQGLQETFRERVRKVEAEQEVIRKEMEPLNRAKKLLDEMGITLYSWHNQADLKKQLLAAFTASIPSTVRRTTSNAVKALGTFQDAIDKFTSEHGPEEGAP